jgi:diguanylate cyclase (GGDEF)-like protein
LKLLIAEDDLTSRTMLTVITREWGYEPVVVEDGEAAWQILQGQNPPRLLLLDWMMPQLNGLLLCQRIRQQQNNDPPYIILLTARSETMDIVVGLESGANDYIGKPFENAELQARLKVGKRMLDLQSQLQNARATLIHQANHDELTGLLNRRGIMEALEREMARAQRQQQTLSVGLCDIDHFKQVNDVHGHLIGDAVLRDVARRLGVVHRPYDMVGRYGGEEFLLLQAAAGDQVQGMFERIRCAMADVPFIVDEVRLEVTISCGVSLFTPPRDKRDGVALLAAADSALYEAKASGRNCTVLDQSTPVSG